MSSASSAPVANRLLVALPRKDHQHVLAGCDKVQLAFSEVLAEPGVRIRHLYFPTGSLISLVTPGDNRTSVEVGLVGNEGMLGISLILGIDISPLRAVVQGEGSALRINTARFRRLFDQSPALQKQLKRYLHVTISHIAQAAACSHFHLVEARLARWLLMTQDRVHSNSFYVTHDFLAHILGVRRAGVTKAATSLQNRSLISYSRGNVTVNDRRGLEAASCGCYTAGREAYARIMRY